MAAERAYRLGCNCLQIFSSSPRQWKPYILPAAQCEAMRQLRRKYGLKPLVIHSNYLINLAGINPEFHRRSIMAFRGELERALALGAEYLVLHPGSYRGDTREGGIQREVLAIEKAAKGLDLAAAGLSILIENTAGAEFSLGSKLEQVAELVERLRASLPVAACIDTCHIFVAGYDISTKDGWEATLKEFDRVIGLEHLYAFHVNDSASPLGSRVDRHKSLGQGKIGIDCFKIMMSHPNLREIPKYLETPDGPAVWKEEIKMLREFANVPHETYKN